VTTQAYPRFAANAPGLAVGGRKTWAPGKTLEQLFKAQLGIAPSQYKAMVEQLCESAVEVGREVIEAARNEPRWHNVAKGMVHAWNEGMASLRSVRREKHLKGLTAHIEAAGFSGAPRPEPPRTTGHSELLARRSSVRRRRTAAPAKGRMRKKPQ